MMTVTLPAGFEARLGTLVVTFPDETKVGFPHCPNEAGLVAECVNTPLFPLAIAQAAGKYDHNGNVLAEVLPVTVHAEAEGKVRDKAKPNGKK